MTEHHTSHRKRLSFNHGWMFLHGEASGAEYIGFDDSGWESVTLPHTPRLEDINVIRPYQGICWYRKRIQIDSRYTGRRLRLEFEAAMQEAAVYVNGNLKSVHVGGYLPFSIDITDDVVFGGDNVVAVRLDNTDNGDIPPGKATEHLDFCYIGGLYRNAFLHVTGGLHVTDAVQENLVASGGVFITYPKVSTEHAILLIKAHVKNETKQDAETRAEVMLLDAQGTVVQTSAEAQSYIRAGEEHTFEIPLAVFTPRLWSPDDPYLYNVAIDIFNGNEQCDRICVRAGIRKIIFSAEEGFVINGTQMMIRGANRHQMFPYVGNAASDRAQYRDARKLKDAGFNFVRLAHYPQSPAFLDACDELGLMVVEPVPGWQWCRKGAFQEIALQNVRDMVRRDRNHPCIVLWETSLNETDSGQPGAEDRFFRMLAIAAHEEYPGDQMVTCGDTVGRDDPALVAFDVPYSEWDDENMRRHLSSLPNKRGLDREYGDWEFGGNESTTRCTAKDGEAALLIQAWNFQWSHNRNLANPRTFGDCVWVGIDYNRGYCPPSPICECGCLDVFRNPKPSYYFYQSQRRQDKEHEAWDSGPMVFIANYWTERQSPAKLIVFSNCETVALYLNGMLIEERNPDDGPDTDYLLPRTKADPNYWLLGTDRLLFQGGSKLPFSPVMPGELHNGGNCRQLAHPPFTFNNIPFEAGELKAVGIIGGMPAAAYTRRTPESPEFLTVEIDKCGQNLLADGADFVFVRANVMDRQGTIVPSAQHRVTFHVDGPAKMIGQSPVLAEAGTASILLKAGVLAGDIVIRAEAEGLLPGEARISSSPDNSEKI